MENINAVKVIKIESDVDIKKETDVDFKKETDVKGLFIPENIQKIKQEYDEINYKEKQNISLQYSTSEVTNSHILESLLIKPEVESEVEESYELSQSDIEKEFEAFNKEDEKKNSGKTILENNTTAYKCQICGDIFQKFPEYKNHKRNHFIEKRRFV